MPAASVLDALNYHRETLAQQGMGVLGLWALLNLVVSGWLVARVPRRQEPYYFHQMNVGWAMVNVTLAVLGILRARPLHVAGLSLADSLAAQSSFESILLVNVGLDVAYVVTGAWLRARAIQAEHPNRLLGFGRSLWVQGGFLFVFDAALYFVYHRYAAELLALVP
ncbi:hypothetical protein F0P96_09925 [Hymenobacter busanensis]|uniref:Uncharacterized protein n=1 Tax=Hymenobacter busanensis TaxID=2607656 RepID=A0A7L5A2M8_9BACT|nr:hypothetical protein [Hymenobacter busanensis]KAA9333283.1 hypothetical protein F0P96_09925 [Hymenobacter busanensis]QHJ08040.1 hypothetical protein GUY19_12395 [Hymenobacter busanensis]